MRRRRDGIERPRAADAARIALDGRVRVECAALGQLRRAHAHAHEVLSQAVHGVNVAGEFTRIDV